LQALYDVARQHAIKDELKPINPVKPVKAIRIVDWLTGLIALTDHFASALLTDGTSYRCIMSSTSRRSMLWSF